MFITKIISNINKLSRQYYYYNIYLPSSKTNVNSDIKFEIYNLKSNLYFGNIDNNDFNLWQTPTHISHMCLMQDDGKISFVIQFVNICAFCNLDLNINLYNPASLIYEANLLLT